MTFPDQAGLIASLSRVLGEAGGKVPVRVLETHISYVLLTGSWAYKIKKAVKLGFLDFSTLALRHFYCQEELRLNRRTAPELYLEVLAIGGSPAQPVIGGPGPAIEYAVKMREFPQEDLASRMLARGALKAAHVDRLALSLAQFHDTCARAGMGSGDRVVKGVAQPARDNFVDIRRLLGDRAPYPELDRLEQWTEQELAARSGTFFQRMSQGFVRECHGDLHLSNIACVDGELRFFDCIEFSADLRWIDVMNEVAFLVMDLDLHGRRDYAYRFLNAYLERTGDYAGLAVLRFYVVYRALVRAKVALLSGAQAGAPDGPGEFRSHVDLAARWARPPRTALILTQGLSGSGKTSVAQGLLAALGAVRLRSDVERKRLAGLDAQARSAAPVGGGLYAADKSEATYARLLALAQGVLQAGYPVIVDAAFLRRRQRLMFSNWAHAQRIPFAILSLVAPDAVLRERVQRRAREGQDASDADLAVLDHQLGVQEALTDEETGARLTWDASLPADATRGAALARALQQRLGIGLVCATT